MIAQFLALMPSSKKVQFDLSAWSLHVICTILLLILTIYFYFYYSKRILHHPSRFEQKQLDIFLIFLTGFASHLRSFLILNRKVQCLKFLNFSEGSINAS